MNERIKELIQQATKVYEPDWNGCERVEDFDKLKFAELLIKECGDVLFNESERLFELYSEEDNMRLAEQYEVCSDQCIDNIALIEKHFGIE